MYACCRTCVAGCGLGRTGDGAWRIDLNPAAGTGIGPNRDGMFKGLKGDVDRWEGLLTIGVEEFGGIEPGKYIGVLGGP